jgi:methylated-DNA-[protein]-cysteine S-methyltransferase
MTATARPALRTAFTTVESPIGPLLLIGDERGLRGLYMAPHAPDPAWREDPRPFADATLQLEQYFAGERTEFELALAPEGTPFQQAVWGLLREIPYGETRSYGELAGALGKGPRAARAVGLANGRNPISIVVPCHRVIGADGSLTGFGGGLDRKRALLELEAEVREGFRSTLW